MQPRSGSVVRRTCGASNAATRDLRALTRSASAAVPAAARCFNFSRIAVDARQCVARLPGSQVLGRLQQEYDGEHQHGRTFMTPPPTKMSASRTAPAARRLPHHSLPCRSEKAGVQDRRAARCAMRSLAELGDHHVQAHDQGSEAQAHAEPRGPRPPRSSWRPPRHQCDDRDDPPTPRASPSAVRGDRPWARLETAPSTEPDRCRAECDAQHLRRSRPIPS